MIETGQHIPQRAFFLVTCTFAEQLFHAFSDPVQFLSTAKTVTETGTTGRRTGTEIGIETETGTERRTAGYLATLHSPQQWRGQGS